METAFFTLRQTKKLNLLAYFFIEQPFGRGREAINELIDLLVYIDVPLEIALARSLW